MFPACRRVAHNEWYGSRLALRFLQSRNSGDFDEGAGGGGVDGGEARGDVARDGVEGFRARGGFGERGDGLAGVAADADLRVNLDFAEEGHAEGLGHVLAFAVAEDGDAFVLRRAIEAAHVLDEDEDFNVDLAEHFDGFADVGEVDDGGRGDDDGAADGDALNQG